LPVVARVDRVSGAVLGVASWPIDDTLRELPSITDIGAGGDAVWVAAPNAGGLVRLSPNLDEESQLIPMEATIGTISAHGATCWARQKSHGGEPDGSLGPAVWRVTDGDAVAVAFGGYVWQIAAEPEGLLVLMQRPARTHAERRDRGAGTAWLYPGVLARVRADAVEHLIDLEDLGGASLFVVGRQAWILSGGHADPPWLAEVDLVQSVLGRQIPLPWPVIGLAVDGQHAWVHTSDSGHLSTWDRQEVFVRVPLANGAGLEHGRVVVRGDVMNFVVDGSFVWASREAAAGGERPPLRINTNTLEAVEWPVQVDLTALLPTPRPPEGVDPVSYAEQERAGLERSRIEDVQLERVFVQGQFPDTQVVAHFRSPERRGVLFGRRWSLFDDYGNLQDLSYVPLELEENVVAADHGLPPINRCLPNADGVVWF